MTWSKSLPEAQNIASWLAFLLLSRKKLLLKAECLNRSFSLSAPSYHSSSNRAHLQTTLLLTQQTLQLCRHCLYPFSQLLPIMCSLQMTFLLWNRGKLLAELLSLLHEPITAALPSCACASQWPHTRTSKAGIWRTERNFIAKQLILAIFRNRGYTNHKE